MRKALLTPAGITAVLALWAAPAFAAEAIELPTFDKLGLVMPAIWIVFFSAIFGLLVGGMWLRAILKEDPGSQGMRGVAAAIQDGAMAYLKRQVATMSVFVVIVFVGLVLLYRGIPEFGASRHGIPIYVGVGVAFIMGVAASYIAGFVGMMMAVRANVRAANAALSSFRKALYVAFRAIIFKDCEVIQEPG